MKRLSLGLLTLLLVVGAVALSDDKTPLALLQVVRQERNPWNHLRLNNDPHEFRFALVSDRTGGHREKVFSQTIEKLNLLQPEFVVSVGDLIEGGKTITADKGQAQWQEFQGFIDRLQMPFFYLPGNHDIGSPDMDKLWQEKFGRRWYHFVYCDVLFLLLNSEDPPGVSEGHLSAEQLAYAERALTENRGVRWTIVVTHKPLWTAANVERTGWLAVEKALGDRPYTVFVGHKHIYKRYVRNNRNYYQLATTGGGSKLRGVAYGEFDHVVLVTMKKTGPVLANVLVEGIFAEDLKDFATKEPGAKRAVKPAHPVQGQLTLDGKPLADARVTFHLLKGPATNAPRPEALTAANGTFILTTYARNDGAPAGEYAVTVTAPEGAPEEKSVALLMLPERYAKQETSDLRATVAEGLNQFTLELKK